MNYFEYYNNQAGGALDVYSPFYQRGSGLGTIFKSLYRFVKPIAKTLGKKALEIGSDVTKDVLAGKGFKEAALQRGKRFLQTGSGKRRYKKRKRSDIFT